MLDAVGPMEVLSLLPGAQLNVTAKAAGIIWPDNQAMPFFAPYAIDDVGSADLLIIPGGPGTDALERDQDILEWVRRIDETTEWTCSVCTGALVLAASGLLAGLEATTHWGALPRLAEFGAFPVSRRWVEQGKLITAAGVSAGIDMGLLLASRVAGDRAAQAIQLAIEYDPAPPFDTGSVEKAGPEIVGAVLDGTIEMNRSGRSRPAIRDAT